MGSHLPFTCRDVEICAWHCWISISPAEEEMVEEHQHCDACAEMIDAMARNLNHQVTVVARK